MPSESQTRAVIHPSVIQRINETLPKHKIDQGISDIINDLAWEALDTRATISGPPGRYSYSSNSNSFEELEKESVREKGRETFLTPISENFVCHDEKKQTGLTKKQRKVIRQAKETNTLPDDFLEFWQTYQTAPRKANQSRKKAYEAWKIALQYEKSDRLIEAARRAVLDQTNKMQQEEWFEPLPDCYRWLRDEKFVVLLEQHTPAKAKQIIPGVTCL